MFKRVLGVLCLFSVCAFFVACGGITAAKTTSTGNPPTTPPTGNPPPSTNANQINNIDDNAGLSGWRTCVIGACSGNGTPGGSHPPASYGFTNGVTDHSCDGYAAYLTETSADVDGNASSNILTTYMAGSQDDVHTFTSSYCFYLTGTVSEAEFDTFQFNRIKDVEFMFGTQCVTGRDWDIWNQKTGSWVSLGSSVPCTLTFNAYHRMSRIMHWDPSDTGNCEGEICMYYDSMVMDGTTLCAPCGSPQPSGKLPEGWASNSGFQFQIDITAANETGGMYIDVADFSESD
jgi:hypothetical protein